MCLDIKAKHSFLHRSLLSDSASMCRELVGNGLGCASAARGKLIACLSFCHFLKVKISDLTF